MKLPVKVVPGASRDSMEWLGEDRSVLKVRVTAAPEKGKANKAVVKLLASRLDLPVSAVTIVGGAASQQKLVNIDGLTEADVRGRL